MPNTHSQLTRNSTFKPLKLVRAGKLIGSSITSIYNEYMYDESIREIRRKT
jgi:hypothetical protein